MRADADLVNAAAAGDQTAWNELVDRHSQVIYANSRAIGAGKVLAEDIVQIVWLRLLTRLDTLNDPNKVKGWLAMVSRNATRDELRKVRFTADIDDLIDLTDPATDTAADALINADLRKLGLLFDSLSEKCRRILSMLFYAEMSYANVAEVEGIPIGSVSDRRRTCLHEIGVLMEARSE